MNEFKRCMTVFTHSLQGALNAVEHAKRDMFNNKPHQDDNLFPLSYVAVRRFHFAASILQTSPAALFRFFLRICNPSQNICLATVDII